MTMSFLCYIRDTPAGNCLRFFGFMRWLRYQEETEEFQPPSLLTLGEARQKSSADNVETSERLVVEDFDMEAINRRVTTTTIDEVIPVIWLENDADNPKNWSNTKKLWTLWVVNIYTFAVYCAASLITPATETIMHRYGVSIDIANLGLSVYVVGYGVGPMIFSPISEIAAVGRNPPYLYPFFAFLAVSIAIVFLDNFPALVILRFLQGFFGSPILASGGASIEDVYDKYDAPYGYIFWVASMYGGPALGPLIAGYAVKVDWRWPFYEILILAGVVLVSLPFLPETNPSTILLRRAQRLRKATGNEAYLAPSELKPIKFTSRLFHALIKPLEISTKDPAIAYSAVYTAIVYGTYYSFFEAFPIVYLGYRNMTLGDLGLIFLSIIVGCALSMGAYYLYLRIYFIPRAKLREKNGNMLAQEAWLVPGLLGVWGPPLGLFLFAWTAAKLDYTTENQLAVQYHWIVPTIGIAFFALGSFWVFQSIICYIPLTYPKYVASLFAANDLSRSLAAAGFVHFSRPMYINLGIDRGVTLVAGLSFIGVFGMYGLWYFGARLRARSIFTE